ncbi:MAG: Diphosphomevalonate decarboxylase [Myxococcaceae bacterium]|nr:Diphosphomevalonate decarboxylase [Myxococcaceae bacterium]
MTTGATTATAIAHPNIALAKYWGKTARAGNYPAVPSLSVTLEGMTTTTRVSFDAALARDRVVLNGGEPGGDAHARACTLLDRVRAATGEKRFASIDSTNDFPTASGLASSASGFAALALAATRAAGNGARDLDASQVSDLARRSSASAARSVFGGFVELAAGSGDPADEVLSAKPVAPIDHLDLRVLVCVTREGKKAVGSTDGMRRTAASSPYYRAWLDAAPRMFEALRAALLAKDFEQVGTLAEASALAMHASAIAAGVIYFEGATLAVLEAVRSLRSNGLPAWSTIDAGPHVKVLVHDADAARITEALAAVPGVLRVLYTRPGEGARLA